MSQCVHNQYVHSLKCNNQVLFFLGGGGGGGGGGCMAPMFVSLFWSLLEDGQDTHKHTLVSCLLSSPV